MPAGAPMAGATDPYAPLSKTPELDKAIADTEKAADKTALAAAYSKRGMFRMKDDDKAGQRVKYRAALSDFRKALAADPKNVEALAAKSEIESIYTGMGRPVPSEAEADEVSKTGVYKPKTGE
jgi:tetratricopeptide (TPR) repeat protein